jgi:oligopeptide transport system ATP-binding protein
MDDAPLLRVSDLETAFVVGGEVFPAVRRVSFELRDGQTLGLVGESGCGKSVTALSIIRLLSQNGAITGGSVELRGEDLVCASDRRLEQVRGRRIAMVFQDSMTSLNPLLSIGRQITEGLEVHLGMSRRQARRRAVELLVEVGVPEPERRLRQYPHQLSGGLRQRVAVAVALAPNPELLIADEPTTALDVTIQAQLLELLQRERADRGMALLLITHDLGVVAGLADDVCVMYAGRIVERGSTHELFESAQHPYTLGLLRSVPRLDSARERRLASIPGTPPALSELGEGCAFRARCPIALDRCASEDPELLPAGDAGSAVACWASVREPAA